MNHELTLSLFAGKNLQICFMNEAASDSESSDSETCPKLSQGMSRKKNVQRSSSLMNHRNASLSNNPYNSRPLSVVKSVMDPVEKGENFLNCYELEMSFMFFLSSLSWTTSNISARSTKR